MSNVGVGWGAEGGQKVVKEEVNSGRQKQRRTLAFSEEG